MGEDKKMASQLRQCLPDGTAAAIGSIPRQRRRLKIIDVSAGGCIAYINATSDLEMNSSLAIDMNFSKCKGSAPA